MNRYCTVLYEIYGERRRLAELQELVRNPPKHPGRKRVPGHRRRRALKRSALSAVLRMSPGAPLCLRWTAARISRCTRCGRAPPSLSFRYSYVKLRRINRECMEMEVHTSSRNGPVQYFPVFILVPIECHGTLLYNLYFVEILRVFTYLLYCNILPYVPKIHKSFDQIEKVRIRNLLQ